VKHTLKSLSWVALGVVWLAGTGTALVIAGRYRAAAGVPARAPDEWPAASAITRDPSRPTVVMLAHPRCPCTRASLSELARLMTEVGDRAAVHVLFARPDGVASDWALTDTWAEAQRIPNVRVHLDPGGRQALLFGAQTSGQVIAFGPDGKRLFSGGITPGRDHEGDNMGHDRLRAVILGGALQGSDAPVYGCALHDAVATLKEVDHDVGHR
jgi:hypothetical protein